MSLLGPLLVFVAASVAAAPAPKRAGAGAPAKMAQGVSAPVRAAARPPVAKAGLVKAAVVKAAPGKAAVPGKAAPAKAGSAAVKGKPAVPAAKGKATPAAAKTAAGKRPGKGRSDEEAPPPAEGDPDAERIQRLQEALFNIVHGPVLGRLRTGMRVLDLTTGRVLYGHRGSALMDPASNQKVLATTTALLRLGADWQFRTELVGPEPDAEGVITGDVVLQGNGDPSLRSTHLDEMASELAARGVTRVMGGVLADPRRIGTDEPSTGRAPLRVSHSAVEIHVRPADKENAPPLVFVRPASDAFQIENRAKSGGKGRGRISVALSSAGGRIHIVVNGRIGLRHPGLVVRRVPPNAALYAAALFRASLVQAGIDVKSGVGTYAPRLPEPRRTALVPMVTDSLPPLDPPPARAVLALHESAPLAVLMRRINKDSDNEWAERVLEAVGAEIYGGAATPAKGVRALREAMSDLGVAAQDFVPMNGSGLGHANRITPEAMADLLRQLLLDPRIGPDLVQSLSVGGIDGTTRNRFRGSPAAERVRAKTGTLNGKSCLSGYVGDGSDVLVFSIMVQGLRHRALTSVRHAQVTAVNAMMRYARGAVGPAPGEELTPGEDLEAGEEPGDSESENGEEMAAPATPGTTPPPAPPGITPPPLSSVTPPPVSAPPTQQQPLAKKAAPSKEPLDLTMPKESLDSMVQKALKQMDAQRTKPLPPLLKQPVKK